MTFFMEKATINGIEQDVNFLIRLLFVVPTIFTLLIWYWMDIRPIVYTKKIIETELKLIEIKNPIP